VRRLIRRREATARSQIGPQREGPACVCTTMAQIRTSPAHRHSRTKRTLNRPAALLIPGGSRQPGGGAQRPDSQGEAVVPRE